MCQFKDNRVHSGPLAKHYCTFLLMFLVVHIAKGLSWSLSLVKLLLEILKYSGLFIYGLSLDSTQNSNGLGGGGTQDFKDRG